MASLWAVYFIRDFSCHFIPTFFQQCTIFTLFSLPHHNPSIFFGGNNDPKKIYNSSKAKAYTRSLFSVDFSPSSRLEGALSAFFFASSPALQRVFFDQWHRWEMARGAKKKKQDNFVTIAYSIRSGNENKYPIAS